jgi:hypothetical protein
MAKHISETFVSIPGSDRTIDLLCAILRGWSFSTTTNHSERLLAFDDGRVIITNSDGSLHLRVEAEDRLTLLGIRSVLQVAFSQVPTLQILELEWNPAVTSHPSDLPPERARPQRIK